MAFRFGANNFNFIRVRLGYTMLILMSFAPQMNTIYVVSAPNIPIINTIYV